MDVKQATQSAWNYLINLYGDQVSNLRLEEVELSDDGQYWLITLSYQHASHIQAILKPDIQRQYKVFKMKATDGEIVSMKIRKVG